MLVFLFYFYFFYNFSTSVQLVVGLVVPLFYWYTEIITTQRVGGARLTFQQFNLRARRAPVAVMHAFSLQQRGSCHASCLCPLHAILPPRSLQGGCSADPQPLGYPAGLERGTALLHSGWAIAQALCCLQCGMWTHFHTNKLQSSPPALTT